MDPVREALKKEWLIRRDERGYSDEQLSLWFSGVATAWRLLEGCPPPVPNIPDQTPKTNKVDDMTPFEALDHVKSLRAAWRACNGSLYKNVAVGVVQDFLEECIAKWGRRFMEVVERENLVESFGESATSHMGDKGRRDLVFPEAVDA